MPQRPHIDFWFEFASTYTYLTAMRIAPMANAADVTVRWRPFLLGARFKALGWPADSPFNWQPDKGRHMWRDMERLCNAQGLPLVRPDPFPQPTLLAARVATAIAKDETLERDALPRFARAVFDAELGKGRQIGDPDVLARCLSQEGLPTAMLDTAPTQSVKDQLKAETAKALEAGVFGAPTFITGSGELFWGNDRLEQALDWARREAG
jgi:2-hydroxychromene-2-carboxylate isomerase